MKNLTVEERAKFIEQNGSTDYQSSGSAFSSFVASRIDESKKAADTEAEHSMWKTAVGYNEILKDGLDILHGGIKAATDYKIDGTTSIGEYGEDFYAWAKNKIVGFLTETLNHFFPTATSEFGLSFGQDSKKLVTEIDKFNSELKLGLNKDEILLINTITTESLDSSLKGVGAYFTEGSAFLNGSQDSNADKSLKISGEAYSNLFGAYNQVLKNKYLKEGLTEEEIKVATNKAEEHAALIVTEKTGVELVGFEDGKATYKPITRNGEAVGIYGFLEGRYQEISKAIQAQEGQEPKQPLQLSEFKFNIDASTVLTQINEKEVTAATLPEKTALDKQLDEAKPETPVSGGEFNGDPLLKLPASAPAKNTSLEHLPPNF